MSVKEIEAAIIQLPLKKLLEFSAWFETYQAQIWEQQIETDLATGNLDALLAEVDAEYEAGLAL